MYTRQDAPNAHYKQARSDGVSEYIQGLSSPFFMVTRQKYSPCLVQQQKEKSFSDDESRSCLYKVKVIYYG